jgi:hypothetical protein
VARGAACAEVEAIKTKAKPIILIIVSSYATFEGGFLEGRMILLSELEAGSLG